VSTVDPPTWTGKLRERLVAALPPEKLLPDRQPSYMASWIYVFGVLTLASLVMIIGSGTILALKGPGWWHVTGIGHFFNSIHLWAVELFFLLHGEFTCWGKYWMAAWRGGRARVWMTVWSHFWSRIPVRPNRLRLAAELRCAVDLDPGEGRDELEWASARSSTS